MKKLIVELVNAEKAPYGVLKAIRQLGGIDKLTEEEAAKLVKRFKLEPKPVDPEAEAYAEYRKLVESRKFWLDMRSEVGEAHGFGEMCGYDDSHDVEKVNYYNAKIAAIDEKLAELRPLATRHAKHLNMPLWGMSL